MSVTARIGSAVAAGYLLGRFRKLGTAVVLGSALANKDLRERGLALWRAANGRLFGSPEARKLADDVKVNVFDAAKTAAVTMAASRIHGLSDWLSERSANLRRETSGADHVGEPGFTETVVVAEESRDAGESVGQTSEAGAHDAAGADESATNGSA